MCQPFFRSSQQTSKCSMFSTQLRFSGVCMCRMQRKYRVVPQGDRIKDLITQGGRAVTSGDCVVDATCGNGRDSVKLANLVGSTGEIHAFDIQQSAIEETRELLQRQEGELPELHMHHESHVHIAERVGECDAALVVFNLGYLPGADHAVCTTGASTITALEASMQVLRKGGLLSVVTYTGHAEGLREHAEAVKFLSDLPTDAWLTTCLSLLNRKSAPQLLCAWKR